MLLNDITDRYYGWPLSDQDFEKYVKDKYAQPLGVHHYEITQSSGPTTGNGPDDYSHKIEVNSTETVLRQLQIMSMKDENKIKKDKSNYLILDIYLCSWKNLKG